MSPSPDAIGRALLSKVGCSAPRDWPPHWRAHTWDPRVITDVVDADEYRLEEVLSGNGYDVSGAFDPLDVVMDLGAHIGSFSWACLARGARRVFAYEVEPRNFRILEANLAHSSFPVAMRNVAIWRSDIVGEPLFYAPDLGAASTVVNTGTVQVGNHRGQPVPAVMRFDDAIKEAAESSPHGRVRLAKLDVEGSEFPILYTAKRLELVDELVGEYHAQAVGLGMHAGLPPFTVEALTCHLRQQGFGVTRSKKPDHQPGFGLFRAKRERPLVLQRPNSR